MNNSLSKTQPHPFESIFIKRLIAAPAERIFAAWTQPELLKNWWGPPGSKVHSVEINLKIGGSYRIGIVQPNGEIYFVFGQYKEIDPPHKLTFTWRWEQPEMDIGTSQVSLLFEEDENGTQMSLTHSDLPNPDAKLAHEQGWLGILENLALFFK